MDDFASNRNTITMLVVIDLYTTSLEPNHYCREPNQLQSWSAYKAETNSSVLTPYTLRLGPLSTWSALNKMELTKSCRSMKDAIGVDLYRLLVYLLVHCNKRKGKGEKSEQTYIAKKTLNKKCASSMVGLYAYALRRSTPKHMQALSWVSNQIEFWFITRYPQAHRLELSQGWNQFQINKNKASKHRQPALQPTQKMPFYVYSV